MTKQKISIILSLIAFLLPSQLYPFVMFYCFIANESLTYTMNSAIVIFNAPNSFNCQHFFRRFSSIFLILQLNLLI